MDRRLYEASLHGSVHSLNELMEENELILHRVSLSCFHETPLHIAAMLGHFHFVRAILSRNPKLASELDSQGCSPLHLASAEGYVQIVRELLMIDTNVCSVGDQDGRTPLHLAAVRGRVDVIKELVQARPEVTRIKADHGETALHLCVEHYRLEALKVLVESVTDDEFINSKDHNGNTVLHLAAAKKQMQTIKYLLSRTGVEVNAMNSNGFTAIDVVEHCPRDLKAMEVRECLGEAKALRARDLALVESNTKDRRGNEISPVVPPPSRGSNWKKHFKNQNDWLQRKRDTIMVTATLIAAMALQAGLNPPGGVWQEDSKEKDDNGNPLYLVGTSILAYHYPEGYRAVMVYNTLSFIMSLSIILLLISGVPIKRKIFLWILMASMWITISFMALTYLAAMQLMAPVHEDNAVTSIIGISILVWLALIAILVLIHAVRFFLWVVRKVREYRKRKLSSSVNERQGNV